MVKGNLHFSRAYFWLTVVSLLDVLLTCMVLAHGGRELNPIAHEVIHRGGLPALLAFKFTLMLLIVLLCELFSQRRPRMGRLMVHFAVAVWGLPPAFALFQLGA